MAITRILSPPPCTTLLSTCAATAPQFQSVSAAKYVFANISIIYLFLLLIHYRNLIQFAILTLRCPDLAQVPNQPISFPSDATHAQRKEDGIIAYTWEHFLTNTSSDPNWLLQFPQVKSAVRAMDAVQEFTETLDIPRVKSFVMGGASKRGWTTWLASGIDKRVEAFIPVVMPILNIKPNLDSAFRSLGG